jgi:hypothetical protein
MREFHRAAELLESISFDLYDGTNFFNDEFRVLYLNCALPQYVELSAQAESRTDKDAYRRIAETVTEIGTHIRFIAFGLDTQTGPQPVPNPSLAITSDTVERALADCEQLIRARGATSGVDRVHTAFHGYVRKVCAESGMAGTDDASVTKLFKYLRTSHPSFIGIAPTSGEIEKIAHGMAMVVDALNPLRNQATLAHPNEAVLEEAEAMFVINAVRTLLHYLNAKLT